MTERTTGPKRAGGSETNPFKANSVEPATTDGTATTDATQTPPTTDTTSSSGSSSS